MDALLSIHNNFILKDDRVTFTESEIAAKYGVKLKFDHAQLLVYYDFRPYTIKEIETLKSLVSEQPTKDLLLEAIAFAKDVENYLKE